MGKINELKQENINLIKKCFYDGNVWTKNELSKQTKLALSSTTNILQKLLNDELITYVGNAESTGGRKSKNYQINKDYQHILKIILKRESDKYVVKTTLNDLKDNILKETTQEIIQGSLEEIMLIIEEHVNRDELIDMIVISLPGVCVKGVVRVCDYQKLFGIDVYDEIYQRFRIDSVIENDVNVACIGFKGDYPNIGNLAFVYQPESDYVGCGMIINHQLYNGFSHFAGELRYLPEYSHEYQDKMIKENPARLLSQQISTLTVVLNPQIIGYCSDVIKDEIVTFTDLDIDKEYLPQLVKITNLNHHINRGLYVIAINSLKERGQ